MPALERDLEAARAARRLIPDEQAKLRALLADERDPTKRALVKYQIDLVALQLARAADAADERLEHLRTLRTDAEWKAERAKCEADTLYWFRWWAWSLDPRPDAPLSVIPFHLFDFQQDAVRWLDALVFERRSSGVVEKSRDMGATWFCASWAVKHWLFRDHFSCLFGSINENKVDKRDEPDTIFEKIRFQIRRQPPKLLPEGFSPAEHCTFMHVGNPANGSVLKGEAPTPNFGRSGRFTAMLYDEHAFWPFHGTPQWTAGSQSTKSQISFSSVNGKRTKQYELKQAGRLPVLRLHWKLHPWKDERWYGALPLSMRDHEIKQEIDIDYDASQSGRLLAAFTEALHVVTHSEFIAVFGREAQDERGRFRLPMRGRIGCAQDVGTTEGHPNGTVWVWRPTEEMPLSDCVFVYREMLRPEWPVSATSEGAADTVELAKLIYDAEKPWDERRRTDMRLISHEGASERLTYERLAIDSHRLHFSAWAIPKRAGLAQLQSFLAVDPSRRNPFRRFPADFPGKDEEGQPLAGQLLLGYTRLYVIVTDKGGALFTGPAGELMTAQPLSAADLPRTRAEIPEYRLPEDTAGDEKKEPKPLFNECVDCLKALADRFFPKPEEMSAQEKARRALATNRPDLAPERVAALDPDAQVMAIVDQMDAYAKELTKARSGRVTVTGVAGFPRR